MPAAQKKVDAKTSGLPDDHPAIAEGETFLEDERRKGRAWMAAGGVAAGLGVVGVAVGIQQLVKAKKLREGRVTAHGGFDRRGAFVGLSVRF